MTKILNLHLYVRHWAFLVHVSVLQGPKLQLTFQKFSITLILRDYMKAIVCLACLIGSSVVLSTA